MHVLAKKKEISDDVLPAILTSQNRTCKVRILIGGGRGAASRRRNQKYSEFGKFTKYLEHSNDPDNTAAMRSAM